MRTRRRITGEEGIEILHEWLAELCIAMAFFIARLSPQDGREASTIDASFQKYPMLEVV
jgi:hypothetical protein